MTCNDEEGVNCYLEEKKQELCQYEECILCADEVEADENGYYEAAEVKEVFAELYDVSAKCETSNGFDNGMNSNNYYAQDDVANPPTRLPTESLSVISSPPRLLIPNTERLPLEDPRYTLPVEPQQLKDRSLPLLFSLSEL